MTDLHAAALKVLHGGGLHFDQLVPDGRFHRARKPNDAQWYVANEGEINGKPWLELSAGDFRETGGEPKATVVSKSWVGQGFTRDEVKEIGAIRKMAKVRTAAQVSAEQDQAARRAARLWR